MPIFLKKIKVELAKDANKKGIDVSGKLKHKPPTLISRKLSEYDRMVVSRLDRSVFLNMRAVLFTALVPSASIAGRKYKIQISFHNVLMTPKPTPESTIGITVSAGANAGKQFFYKIPTISENPVRMVCSCFTADTLIPLAEGYSVPIKDLVGKEEFFVYSFDTKTNKTVIGRGYNCEIKHANSELYEIELDNGHKIKCTPDHKFLLKTGKWVRADKLSANDSIEPMYRRLSTEKDHKNMVGYEMLYNNGKWEYTHRLADSYNLENEKDIVSNGPVRHHADFNKRNNSPDNIKRMTTYGHIKLHADNVSGDRNPMKKKEVSERVRLLNNKKIKKQESLKAWLNSENNGVIGVPHDKFKEIGYSEFRHFLSAIKTFCAKDKRFLYQNKSVVKQDDLYNHKVVSVKKLSYKEPVYCFTVDKYRNFVIDTNNGTDCSSGIVAHNCNDFRHRFSHQLDKEDALIGAPMPYTRETPPWEQGGRPYANATDKVGMCKHVYSIITHLKAKGLIKER